METQKRFSIKDNMVVLFAFGLLFSCEQLAPVEEPVAVLEEFQDLSGIALEPEDDPINGRLIFSSDCESDCIETGSGNYFAIRDSKSQSSGINTKKVSYKAYNTQDKFVVKVKYEVTSGSSQAKASIAIQIKGKKKEFKAVPSGYTATFSVPLNKGWEKCDHVTFSIVQKGLGSPISFSEDYGLIPVCKVYETFTDPRDGKVYKIIKIGGQVWLAENLNFAVQDSWCYDNNSENCQIYGRLYTWDAAMNACPEGWHLPSEYDWGKLVNFLGGESIAGGKLKSTGTIENGEGLWHQPNFGASNESGFFGLPGGIRHWEKDYFWMKGEEGFFWSSSDLDSDIGLARELDYKYGNIFKDEALKSHGMSCRCIQNVDTDLKVGQEYGGGIIAHILQPGNQGFDPDVVHGLIAAKEDQSDGIEFDFNCWNEGGVYAYFTEIGDGLRNTNEILSYCADRPIAASIARDYQGGGFKDWFLPSLEELKIMYGNREVIGGFADSDYWSSSTYDAKKETAWFTNFNTGEESVEMRTQSKRVRAMRAF